MKGSHLGAVAALAICLVALAPAATRADDGAEEREPTAFERLFPHPTGTNGYEEVVRAGDLARVSAREVPLYRPTKLSDYRRHLQHPASQEALRVLRVGLRKPASAPPAVPGGDVDSPQFAGTRAVARLLAAEQRLALSEGRVADAIRSMEDGLRLAEVTWGDTLLSGLVGVAVEAIATTITARNRDSWSVKDCERLLRIAETWLARPDPSVAALEGERRHMAAWVRRITTASPSELRAMEGFNAGEPLSPNQEAMASGLRSLQGDPAGLASLATGVEARLNADIDGALASLADPRTARSPQYEEEPAGDAPLAERIAHRFFPVYQKSAIKLAHRRVNLRLLAAHAAVRRYQWEHDGALPESLPETGLSRRLYTDPFTGEPLHYRRTGEDAYELWSAGALRGDVSGKRDRITLPWTLPPQ